MGFSKKSPINCFEAKKHIFLHFCFCRNRCVLQSSLIAIDLGCSRFLSQSIFVAIISCFNRFALPSGLVAIEVCRNEFCNRLLLGSYWDHVVVMLIATGDHAGIICVSFIVLGTPNNPKAPGHRARRKSPNRATEKQGPEWPAIPRQTQEFQSKT